MGSSACGACEVVCADGAGGAGGAAKGDLGARLGEATEFGAALATGAVDVEGFVSCGVGGLAPAGSVVIGLLLTGAGVLELSGACSCLFRTCSCSIGN